MGATSTLTSSVEAMLRADLRATRTPIRVTCENGYNFASPEYAELLARSSATAFQHPLWLSAFYGTLAAKRGATPIIVTGREDNGRLRLVVPLILRRVSGIALLESTDLGVSDYAAPVVDRDFAFGAGLSDAVAAVLPPHDIMRIRPVREENVSEWQSVMGGDAHRLDFFAHATRPARDYASWRTSALDSSFAGMLNRKKKRFFKIKGARCRLLTDAGEIRQGIAGIQSQRAGRFVGDLIQQPHVRDFYAEVAVAGAEAGLACTYVIEAQGEAIGHAFGLTHDGRFNYLLIGCDYERHGKHSPGLILYDLMIENWLANGGKIFDFTIGDEPFKASFGTEPTAMYAVTRNATWRGRLASAAFTAREQLRRARRP